MELKTIILVLLSFLFSAFLKGITGLGFSTICLPILASFIEPQVSIPLVILPSLCSNLLIMAKARQFHHALKRFWFVYLSTIPGLVLGVLILHSVNSSISRGTLGSILIVYGVWALKTKNLVLSKQWEKWLASPVGFCTGLVNGLTGSQVMPILPFLLSLNLEQAVFVQAINLSFTFSSVIVLFLLNRFGLLQSQILGIAFLGIVPVTAGILAGSQLRNSLPEGRYRQAVLIFLLIIGSSLLLRL